MPVEEVAVLLLAEPVPLDVAPQLRDGVADLAFGGVVAIEVLPGGEQPLHHEGGLDEIGAVIVGPEVGDGLAGTTVEEVRPSSVEAVRLAEEANDLEDAAGALFASDEAAVRAGDERHHSETGGPHGAEVFIAGLDLERHAGVGVGGVPVVTEAAFLRHGEQFLIGEGAGGAGHCSGGGRLSARFIQRGDAVPGGAPRRTDEIHVAVAAGLLDADGGELLPVPRAVDLVAEGRGVGGRGPGQVDMAFGGLDGKTRRCGWRRKARSGIGRADFQIIEVKRVRLAVVETLNEHQGGKLGQVELLLLGAAVLLLEIAHLVLQVHPLARG